MRRLWAHIIIAFACLVTAFAVFPSLIKGIKTNGDYEVRREFTYQLSQREAEDEKDAPELTADSAKQMASIMEERLQNAGVYSYEISTSSNDIVTVAFSADNTSQYQQITTYLSFSGSFALCNANPDGEPIPGKDFLNGTVYLKADNVNEEPSVIIPVNTTSEAYKSMIEWTRANPTMVDKEAEEEGGETTQEAKYYVYMLYNYVPGDTYKSLQDNNKFNEKVLLTFDVLENDEAGFYYDLGNDNKAYQYICHFGDSNSNEKLDADEVTSAYDQAKFIVNLYNASALDYDVKLIKGLDSGTEVYKNAAVEDIFSLNGIAWTSMLVATIAAFVITSLLLVVFYRLGSLSVITTSTLSIFLAFLFMVAAGLEFNFLALVGFVLVGAISIISGIIYNSKLKDEAYKGRSLKKANAEASRKAILPIVDVHIVGVVVGLLVYLLGGVALHTFAGVFVLGTLVSLLLNTLGLKGMMWLATNATALNGKYRYFAIDENKVPNHMAEEKQSYYGAYADKDISKSKKPVSIVALVAFVAAFVGIIVSGVLNNGPLFKAPASKDTISEIYIVNTIVKLDDESKSPANKEIINDLLANMKTYDDVNDRPTFAESDKHPTLLAMSKEVNEFVITEDKTVEGTTTTYIHTYYQIKLNKILDGSKTYVLDKDGYIVPDMTVNDAFEQYFDLASLFTSSYSNSMILKTVSTHVNNPSPDWSKIALSTFIAVLVLTVYFMIRYRLSRGLAMLIYPVVASAITLGIFILVSVMGLALPASIAVVIPVATILSYVFMILIANKERDLIADERVKDNSVEHRSELAKKALGMAFTSVLAVSVISVYLFINFFGFGPASSSYMYLAGIFGILISLGLIAVTYVPLCNLLYKWFSNIHFDFKPRKNKKNKVQVKKGAEPEEAIFIGIND